jgi:His/Glu/Gln/Arg/opine family amino acid ABC transporter permease subunit
MQTLSASILFLKGDIILSIIFENIIKVIERYWPLFLTGLGYTLLLSLVTVIFGAILGLFVAIMKMSKVTMFKIKPLSFLASLYIEIIRGTPLLLQLYFFYFLLPMLIPALELNKFVCIAVALVFNSSGYVAEIIRAGIEAVDKGQTEAARSLGLNSGQTMKKIIIPQAVKNILPALVNEFVMVIKETSLASTFFVGDLMTQYKVVSGALYLVIEPLIIIGIIYLIVTYSLSKGAAVIERGLKVSE